MLETSLVKVIGRGSTVNLTIDDIEDISVVSPHLHDHLVTNRFMYSTGIINVNVGQRILVKDEIHKIKEIIESESDVTVARFWCDPFPALRNYETGGTDGSGLVFNTQTLATTVVRSNCSCSAHVIADVFGGNTTGPWYRGITSHFWFPGDLLGGSTLASSFITICSCRCNGALFLVPTSRLSERSDHNYV